MELGFQPELNLEQGLQEMLSHWQGFRPLAVDSMV
jgi:hypothetical protein